MSAWLRPVLKTALVGAISMLVVAAFALPAEGSLTPTLTLTVTTQPSNPVNLVLTTRLQGDSSVGTRSVEFFVVSTEFGQDRNVPIGVATLGKDGSASIIYTPTWSGETRFVVRLAGAPAKDAPTATAMYNVPAGAAGPLYSAANPARPFAFMGQAFQAVLLGVVVLVWLTLTVTLVVVVRGLPRLAPGARSATKEG